MCEPDGRRPGRTFFLNMRETQIAYNGRLPTTLPEPIKRARDKDIRGFAGEGNVVERSERYARGAKPERVQDLSVHVGRMLCDVNAQALFHICSYHLSTIAART